MGSRGGEIEEPKLQSLARQGSIYSLTLDDVQNQVVGLRKPLGSMNLDEFLKTVWTVQDNGSGVGWNQALSRQGSVTLSKDLSKKTVDEVWREVQEKKKSGNVNQEQTLGEMTLEDLLVEVGVVGESVPEGNDGECDSVVVPNQQHCNQWMQFQPLPNQQNMVSVYMPSHSVPQPLAMLDAAAYPGNQMSVSVSDTQVLGRKRVAPGDDLEEEKTIERRQKRMIKNRESAARSRARKQAYTHELEIKVSRLEEENARLRRQKDIEKVLPVRPPEPKNQLRRTSSASF